MRQNLTKIGKFGCFPGYATKIEGILPIWLILAGGRETERVLGRETRKSPQALKGPTRVLRAWKRIWKNRPGICFCRFDFAHVSRTWNETCSCACGLYESFRQPRGKPEGPQHFEFPEVSREPDGVLVLHSCSILATLEREIFSNVCSTLEFP